MTIIAWCRHKVLSAYAICKRAVMCSCLKNTRERDETTPTDFDYDANVDVYYNVHNAEMNGKTVFRSVFSFFPQRPYYEGGLRYKILRDTLQLRTPTEFSDVFIYFCFCAYSGPIIAV